MKRSYRLEALENRCCPSCTVELIGETLHVTGDAADNSINVYYWGPGDLSVECDGVPSQFNDSIDKVVIRAGDGNDQVEAGTQFAGDADFPSKWIVDLGRGDDLAAGYVAGIFDAPVSFSVFGGAGADSLITESLGAFSARYDLLVDGGTGNDVIANFYAGTVDGSVNARTLGGNGDDEVVEEFLRWKVNGKFDGSVDVGNGSDFVNSRLGDYANFDDNLPLIVLGFDVAAGGKAEYGVSGSNGHDALNVNYVGRIDGRLRIEADGGCGADDIFANLDIHGASTGRFAAGLHGGNGDDLMDVHVRFFETDQVEDPFVPDSFLDGFAGYTDTPAPMGKLWVKADGGSGLDTCFHSTLVSVSNVENDYLI